VSDKHYSIIANSIYRQELEDPMGRRVNGCDETVETDESGAQFLSRPAEKPPESCIGFRILCSRFGELSFALGLHLRQHVLVDLWKTFANVVGLQPKKIDHHDIAWGAGKIAAIAILPYIIFEPRPPTKAQVLGPGGCHDKPFAM
jgi:hypothetical protein